MRALITILLVAVAAFSTMDTAFAGDRFGRGFERAFGTALGIGAAIIVTDVVNQAVNPRYYRSVYYESAPVVYVEPVYPDPHERYNRRGYHRGYRDGHRDGFYDGYDEGYHDGSSEYYR